MVGLALDFGPGEPETGRGGREVKYDSELDSSDLGEIMRLRNTWVGGAVAVALAASVFACGGGSSSSSESAAPAGGAAAPAGGSGQKVDPATTGDLKGGITIDGTAPKNVEIKMNADPVCVKANSTPQSQE